MELSTMYVNYKHGLCQYDCGIDNPVMGVGVYQDQDMFFVFYW